MFEVAEVHGGERIRNCFGCGTCSVTCPVFAVEDSYNPRKIIRMILLGMRGQVLTSDMIWLCSGCYNCYELCPRDVKITDLMGALRNLAVKEGHVPAAMKASVDQLEKFGRLLEVSDFENQVREKKEMPPLNLTIPEIDKLLDATDVKKMLRGNGGAAHE